MKSQKGHRRWDPCVSLMCRLRSETLIKSMLQCTHMGRGLLPMVGFLLSSVAVGL